jgi:hypothetical protein
MSQTRRLAAILAADVAGYSRLMGAVDLQGARLWVNSGRWGWHAAPRHRRAIRRPCRPERYAGDFDNRTTGSSTLFSRG